jgi:hypothetical protein
LATALVSVGFATAARAGSVTIGNLTVTQVNPFNLGTFDNNVPFTTQAGYSAAITSAGLTQIGFTTDGFVWNGTNPNVTAAPWMDTTNYLD